MGKTTKMWDRRFLGNTDLLTLGKKEREEKRDEVDREKKHLKAYIKGHTQFKHGKTLIPNKLTGKMEEVDKWYQVQQQLTQNQ